MIFCVEDDRGIRDLMVYALNSAGFEVRGMEDGASLFSALKLNSPELIMLDIMLPGEDGIAILQKLRQNPATAEIPIIMATAKGTEYDKVIGLDLGADDYLVKPFEVVELVARVEAVLRRYNKAEQRLTVGDVTVDLEERRVTKAGQVVELTNKEFGLLVLFIKNKNIALFRETLYEKVWEEAYYGDSRTLDLHVQRLRRKLGWEHNLVAVYKVGYRLEVPR